MARLIVPVILNENELRDLTPGKMRNEYLKLANATQELVDWNIIICPKCGRPKDRSDYYMDRNYEIGVYPQCKECLQYEAEGRKDDKGTPKVTPENIQKILVKMDIPYYDSVFKKELNKQKGFGAKVSVVRQYLATIKSLPIYKNKNWKDSQFGSTRNVIDGLDEFNDEEEITIEEGRQRFGKGYTKDDLYWLETEYQDWISRYPCDSKAQETLFKTLCCQLLTADKLRKEGTVTKDIDKSVQDTLAALNIKPSQNSADALTDTLTFSQLIEKWEEEDPIPEPSDEFKDVDGIGHYIRVWFAGWLAKAVGIKNAYTVECEEEIAKYTVQNDNEGYATSDAIYETIFGKNE